MAIFLQLDPLKAKNLGQILTKMACPPVLSVRKKSEKIYFIQLSL